MADEADDAPQFDAVRLMDEVRKGDPEAVALAFRQLFDSGIGRLVLALHLVECGVGNPLGRPGMTAEELFYAVGRHDAAIALAARVYDPAALAVSTLTGELEGSTNEHETELQGSFVDGFGDLGGDDELS